MADAEFKKAFIVAAIGIPAAIVAAVLGTLITNAVTAGPPPPVEASAASGRTSSTPSAPAESSPTPLTTAAPESAPLVVPTKFAPTTVNLSDELSSQWCKRDGNTGFGWNNGTKTVAGKGHTGGFRCLVGYAPLVGYIDFAVPEGATSFTTVAGQSDDASNVGNTVRFEIIDAVSGTVLGDESLPFGSVANFNVPVSDMIRIRLQVSVDSSQPGDTWASWADPTFH